MVTDLNITGKVAQLGRGVLADVSSKLMSEFADSLEASLLPPTPAVDEGADGRPQEADDAAVAAAVGANGSVRAANRAVAGEQPPVREVPRPFPAPAAAAPVDLVRVAGPSVAKRAALVILGFVALWLVTRRRRHAHK